MIRIQIVSKGIGSPVGKTCLRKDHIDIPAPWQRDYGQCNIDNTPGLSSGPILQQKGQPQPTFTDSRFQYRFTSEEGTSENPLNKRAGALTHASDNNERTAVSTHNNDDLTLHSLTAGGQRSKGVNMARWQQIVCQASSTVKDVLNLDGGGSAYIGHIDSNQKPILLARGGDPQQPPRPVANIIIARAP